MDKLDEVLASLQNARLDALSDYGDALRVQGLDVAIEIVKDACSARNLEEFNVAHGYRAWT